MTIGDGIAFCAAAAATIGTAIYAMPFVVIVGPACFIAVFMAVTGR
jgi:hypothetical protein